MSSIQILASQVANQIAAGEVVEGPSSVVKELVENSIDAKATRISVEINNQLRDIRVADDGIAMSLEDLRLAFKRHATSKISAIEDLYSLGTNGFRGEALASIASVSKLTCITRRSEDKLANKLYMEGDREDYSSAGASLGTSVQVSELFFNTPVRLKFLKSHNRERNDLTDLMRAFALAHPRIAFSLEIDSKILLETKPYMLGSSVSESDILKHTLIDIFGTHIQEHLVPLDLQRGEARVRGWLTDLSFSRSDRRAIFTFLNHRILRCPVLRSAIDAAYKPYLVAGKYPLVVLDLELPRSEVDVNVHPNKREVKYKNTNQIYTLVADAVNSAIANATYSRNHSRQIDFAQHETRSVSEQIPLLEDVARVDLLANSQATSPHRQTTGFALSANGDEGTISEYIEPTITRQAPQRKFISRLGAVDISLLETSEQTSKISSQGNKTNFEIVAKADSTGAAVLCRGDFIGENWIKDLYLEFIEKIAQEVLSQHLESSPRIQSQRSRPSAKPSKSVLKQVWERDHYSCVYCRKPLLDPDLVKIAKSKASGPELYRTYVNAKAQQITVNIFDEHSATYDHLLPASQQPELNLDSRNLLTACMNCNSLKSDSLATQTWIEKANQNKGFNAWAVYNADKPLVMAGLALLGPLEIST